MNPKANVVVSCVAKRIYTDYQPENLASENMNYLLKDSQAMIEDWNAVFSKPRMLP